MDVEAGDLLKSLRTTNEEARKSALARPPGFGDLKIIDPTLLGRRDAPPAEGAPSTPWDAQVDVYTSVGVPRVMCIPPMGCLGPCVYPR